MSDSLLIVKSYFKTVEKTLWLFCLLLSGTSIILLYSMYVTGVAGDNVSLTTIITQTVATGIGVIAALLVASFDYHEITALWKIYVPITVILMILTFTPLGIEPEGTDNKAWLLIFNVSVQPSELLKIAFILTFALHLSKVKDRINELSAFALICLHGFAAIVFVALQGDYGSAVIFVFIFVFMLFTAGLSWKIIVPAMIAVAASVPIIWNFVFIDKHRQRFLIAWHPENDYLNTGNQQYIGRIALGSGQLFGKGLFSDSLIRVSAIQTDYIFSHVGQTLGFVGCMFVLILYCMICIRIILIARSSKDVLGTYICVGVLAIIVGQVFVNIGMVLCILPVAGVTLPFLSAGGTSVLTMYLSIGLVCSVYSKNRKVTFFD